MDNLQKFGGEKILKSKALNDPIKRKVYAQALNLTRQAFKLENKIEPICDYEVGEFARTDTSAGINFPRMKKIDVAEPAFLASKKLKHTMKWGGKPLDVRNVQFPLCIAAPRGHLSSLDEPKTRLVWNYPFEMLIIEGQYAPMAYHHYLNKPDTPMLIGESSDKVCSHLLSRRTDSETFTGIDFKSFDATLPAFIIYDAFQILHDNIEWETFKGEPSTGLHRRKWANVWKSIRWYFINTPILMPNGKAYRKNHGIPSGSWLTQIIGSICNYLVITFLYILQQIDKPENKDLPIDQIRTYSLLKVLGDDSAMIHLKGAFDIHRAASDALSILGMIIHPEKTDQTEIATEIKLLGFTYPKGRRYRPTEEWFKMCLYPEFPVRELNLSYSRLIGLYLAGGKWDVKFCQFLQFYESGYECPRYGIFSKDTVRMLETTLGRRFSAADRVWNLDDPIKINPLLFGATMIG